MKFQKIRNMEEFAAVSGISRPTVSKYFNDPTSVRASTRERIEKALETYDYRPNVYAVNQNRRRTKSVGIVVPNLADPFFTEIGREVELACIDAGHSPILLSSHGNTDQEQANLESLRSLKPTGVLLAPFGRVSDVDVVRRFGDDIPLVLFDANIEGAGQTFIGTDHFQSTELIVEYLCRSGEPPCLFEMRNPTNPNANKRRAAYLATMDRLGLEPHILKAEGEGWNFEEIGLKEGGRMLAQGLFATNTVLCNNDRLAIGMLAAAHNLGIKVGRDASCQLRVAGHDDHPFSRFTCPPLTTIAQDYSSIARKAVESLLSLINAENSSDARQETLFDGTLVMRDSA